MNPKFFDVKKEKQDSIINAALKIFSQKGYKDASTDVIVKSAGISKGLLFHYFTSKQGLYEFICDYSQKYMTLELTRTVKSVEKDFFVIATQIEQARCRVKKHYPYMQVFLSGLKYEKDEDAIKAIGNSLNEMNTVYGNIYNQASNRRFVNSNDFDAVVKIMDWINAGLSRDEMNSGNTDPEDILDKYIKYLELIRSHFYKSEINDNLTIAKEEIIERDESIMNGMKMDMTFEERLQAGKRSFGGEGVTLELPKSMEQIRQESMRKKEEEEKNSKDSENTESEKASKDSFIEEKPIEEKSIEEKALDKEESSKKEEKATDLEANKSLDATTNNTEKSDSQGLTHSDNTKNPRIENVKVEKSQVITPAMAAAETKKETKSSDSNSNIVQFMNTSVIMPVAHKVDMSRADKPRSSIGDIIREAESNLSKMEGDSNN